MPLFKKIPGPAATERGRPGAPAAETAPAGPGGNLDWLIPACLAKNLAKIAATVREELDE
ncbi:hypothetical protein GCM10010289_60410 [Streptomyces violascens]|uniref:Uncharacterized protein n=1 Tax=Streptomyces violascens TaxID=67381 RepID=A0ABQ3QMW9_9ACTN|nr:hypothetical protein GCM10010289_60410 [Streptomyces violascens]GHI38598.1 hypothetical protein Sviol_30060 [Streptomyces violascens]